MPTEEQVTALADAMAQLLDDMGLKEQCVCLHAKAMARVAFEPFVTSETAVDYMLSMADAEQIIRECQ